MILPSSFPSVLPTTDSLTSSEPVSLDVVQEKRHVSSARETRLLQRSGIEQIRNLANDLQVPPPNGLPSLKNSRGLPKVYGFVEHYHFTDLWGATLMKQHCRNGTSTSVSASSNSEAVGMNTVFQLPKKHAAGPSCWLEFIFQSTILTNGWMIKLFGQDQTPRKLVSKSLFHTF